MTTSAVEAKTKTTDIIVHTWQTYVKAWNARDKTDREHFLTQAAVADSHYQDPNVELKGHKALADYMAEFHQLIPDSKFVLTRFISHHQKSIACWDLRNSSGKTLFTGVSYGTYNAHGKLTAEHGFFETPDSA